MRAQEQGLRQGLAALALVLDDAQVNRLLDYLELIQKWTKVYNLTAVRDPAEMLTHHLLDSLAVIHPLRRQVAQGAAAKTGGSPAIRLLDVGSGAGLPGIVPAGHRSMTAAGTMTVGSAPTANAAAETPTRQPARPRRPPDTGGSAEDGSLVDMECSCGGLIVTASTAPLSVGPPSVDH